jgi:transposase
MEACASAHHWARAIAELGHAVKLIPAAYVKPFVKRQKNDMADAEAIAEAAARPTMRFVAPKSAAQQAAAMAFRTRELLVRQRTQTINALRGHLAEYGVIAPTGPSHVGRLAAMIECEQSALPAPVVTLARILLAQIAGLSAQIDALDHLLPPGLVIWEDTSVSHGGADGERRRKRRPFGRLQRWVRGSAGGPFGPDGPDASVG